MEEISIHIKACWIYTYKGMLDFSVNVNPFGPSEAVLEAAKRGIDKCCAYPDSQCRALRAALAAKLGVPQEYILPGNGAADLFFSLVTAARPKKALIPIPAFSEYEQALRTAECQIRYHQTEEKENFRLTERFLEELTEDLDLVFLCSPSNPAGQVIPEDLLSRIIRRCGEKKIRLVLDECFIEFADPGKAFYAEREAENWPQLLSGKGILRGERGGKLAPAPCGPGIYQDACHPGTAPGVWDHI